MNPCHWVKQHLSNFEQSLSGVELKIELFEYILICFQNAVCCEMYTPESMCYGLPWWISPWTNLVLRVKLESICSAYVLQAEHFLPQVCRHVCGRDFLVSFWSHESCWSGFRTHGAEGHEILKRANKSGGNVLKCQLSNLSWHAKSWSLHRKG